MEKNNSTFIALGLINSTFRLSLVLPEFHQYFLRDMYGEHRLWKLGITKHNPEANAEAEAY